MIYLQCSTESWTGSAGFWSGSKSSGLSFRVSAMSLLTPTIHWLTSVTWSTIRERWISSAESQWPNCNSERQTDRQVIRQHVQEAGRQTDGDTDRRVLRQTGVQIDRLPWARVSIRLRTGRLSLPVLQLSSRRRSLFATSLRTWSCRQVKVHSQSESDSWTLLRTNPVYFNFDCVGMIHKLVLLHFPWQGQVKTAKSRVYTAEAKV